MAWKVISQIQVAHLPLEKFSVIRLIVNKQKFGQFAWVQTQMRAFHLHILADPIGKQENPVVL